MAENPRAKAIALGLGCGLLGIAIALSQTGGPWLALAAVLMTIGVMMGITARTRRNLSGAWFRLDHFTRFFRKRKKNQPARDPSAWARVLPARWLADANTGDRGLIRRTLDKIGPTVLAVPFRRLVQAICFGLFLWLFFVVCWPYSAVPEAPGRTSDGWRLAAELGETESRFRLTNPAVPEWQPAVGDTMFAEDKSNPDPHATDNPVLELTVEQSSPAELVVKPIGEVPASVVDALLFGQSPQWTVHEKPPHEWPAHYADDLARKEVVPADTFLVIDPLVSLSTALASRSWVWSLGSAGVILIVCVLIPRGFCGYLCPLGTLIDLFDWAIGKRVKKFRAPETGWWVHIKYYVLVGVLIAALGGVLLSGFVAAIPVLTRGLLFIGDPLQTGLARDWHQVPALNSGHIISIVMFLGVLGLGLLRARFWCKYVCPSGAVFSLSNLFRVSERKVEDTCIHCNKCVEVCPFDAIKPDFTTRTADCTLCQTCGGVCPTHAIKFVDRWNTAELKPVNDPPTGETALGRRGFLAWIAGGTTALAGGVGLTMLTKNSNAASKPIPVRPPGSVPEQEFLQMCIRCGECFKACPNHVLQPMSLGQGLEGLWTPEVIADWAGCESSCNACGQVCPTGAIRPLPIEEKKEARMGLAIVNEQTCLPFAGEEACQLCVDECHAAGYHAIDFIQTGTEVDATGQPIEGSGFQSPLVDAEKCVGCGLCQTRCNVINVKDKGLLKESAIIIQAGPGWEDRKMTGSYIRQKQKAPDTPTTPTSPEPSGIPGGVPEIPGDTNPPSGIPGGD